MSILVCNQSNCLPADLLTEYNIKVLPDSMGRESIITPDQFVEYFKDLSESDEIFFLTTSSLGNSMYFTASAGAKQCPNVCVVDSKQQSIGYGLQLLQVAKLIKQGYTNVEIKKMLLKLQTEQASWRYSQNPNTIFPFEIRKMLSGRMELQSKDMFAFSARKRLLRMMTTYLQSKDKAKFILGLSCAEACRDGEWVKEEMILLGLRRENIILLHDNTKSCLFISLASNVE